MADPSKKHTSELLRLFVYGTLKRGYHNHAVYCEGAFSVENAVVPGRLYESASGLPILEVNEQNVLTHGTTHYLADVAAQGRFPVEMASHRQPASKNPTAGGCCPVCGELLAFDDPEPRFSAIDSLEGFRPGRTSVYRRVLLPVYRAEEVVTAWVYVSGMGIPGMKPLPRGIWPEARGWPHEAHCVNRFNAYQAGRIGYSMTSEKNDTPNEGSDSTLGSSEREAPDDSTSGMVRTPEAVYRGLEAVRESGLTNMLDRPAVARIAAEFGFPDTAHWVESNREKYAQGIFKGFVPEYDGRRT